MSLIITDAVLSANSSKVIVKVSTPSVNASAASGKLITVVPESLTTAVPVSEPLSRSDSEMPDKV